MQEIVDYSSFMQKIVWGFFSKSFWFPRGISVSCNRCKKLLTLQEAYHWCEILLTIEVLHERCISLLQNPADYWSFTQKMTSKVFGEECWLLLRFFLICRFFFFLFNHPSAFCPSDSHNREDCEIEHGIEAETWHFLLFLLTT